jgi:hypothetical protein
MLEQHAITIAAAAKLMNLFLDESETGQITDMFLEEVDGLVIVRFQHQRGEDITFQIDPGVFGMASTIEFADMFLRAAYGIGIELEDEFDPSMN